MSLLLSMVGWVGDEDEEELTDTFTNVLLIVSLIIGHGRVRTRSALTRRSILPISKSPWRYLYEARVTGAWLAMMGVTPEVFEIILKEFAPRYYSYRRCSTRGRKSEVTGADALALFFHWTMLSCQNKVLSLIFGLTPSVTSRVLNKAIAVLPAVLGSIDAARVQWPTPTDLALFSSMVESRSGLPNVWGFVDGLALTIAAPTEGPRAWYNGWKSRYQCTNIFVFTPDGCIAYARYNNAGCSHDANTAGRLLDFLVKYIPSPYRLVADTAFPTNSAVQGRIITPLKSGATLTGTIDEVKNKINFHQNVTSTRQAAEWGMRTFQAMFPRLKLALPACHATRHKWLSILIQLFNLRTRLVGINQIRTVYSRDWQPGLEEVSYIKVARYYNIT
jgi:hypothetical protein